MLNDTGEDVPPPPCCKTVTFAVPWEAKSLAGTVADNIVAREHDVIVMFESTHSVANPDPFH
jgi:hypothetical protein